MRVEDGGGQSKSSCLPTTHSITPSSANSLIGVIKRSNSQRRVHLVMAPTSHSPAMRSSPDGQVSSTSTGSKTAPLVVSDSEDTSSDLSDYDSHSDASYGATSRAASTSTTTTATTKKKCPSRASLTSSHTKKRWTHAEDKLLIKAVDKHGKQWIKVNKSLERSGMELRGAETSRMRYALLEAAARRQGEIASHNAGETSSASLRQPQQQLITATTLIAASLALHSRPGTQIFQAWTQEELKELKAIGKAVSAFQKSTRPS